MSNVDKPESPQLDEVWSRASATYGRVGPDFFGYFGRNLAEFAGVTPGSNVLDVACGRGAVLFPLSEMVGAGGHVTGVDYSEGMVRETSSEAKARGMSNLTVLRMSAEKLDFPDNFFDTVTCGFAIFFFPKLDRALSEFRRVLKPRGTLAVSTWGGDDPRWKWLEDLRPKAPTNAEPTGPRFDEPDAMRRLMLNARFQTPEVTPDEAEFFYRDEEDFWVTLWSHGARIFLEKLPTEQSEGVRHYASLKLQELKNERGIPQLFSAIYTRATKPED